MKKILFAILLFASQVMTAGTAEELLAKHHAGEEYKAPFTETFVQPKINKKTVKKGTLTFRSPEYLLMEYSDPKGDYSLIDGENFDVSRDGKETKRKVKGDKGMLAKFRLTLLYSFCGDVEAVAKTNEAKASYEKKGNQIVATVDSDKPHTQKLILTYDAKSGHLLVMEIIEPNGNSKIYSTL